MALAFAGTPSARPRFSCPLSLLHHVCSVLCVVQNAHIDHLVVPMLLHPVSSLGTVVPRPEVGTKQHLLLVSVMLCAVPYELPPAGGSHS